MRVARRTIRRLGFIGLISLLIGCETGHEVATHSPSLTPSATVPTPSITPVRPPAPATNLRIAGAFSASTNPIAGENACFSGQRSPGEVEVLTMQMALSDGQWMAVDLFMPSTPESYSATLPAGDGRPLVRAHRHTRPAGGGQTGDWFAVSGSLVLARADKVGYRDSYGVVSGSVDARLALAGGTKQITLRGTWGCVIEPVANGR